MFVLLLQENLQVYVQKVFSSITQSSSSCPPLMCDVFRSLRHLACKRFPGKCQNKNKTHPDMCIMDVTISVISHHFMKLFLYSSECCANYVGEHQYENKLYYNELFKF